MGTQQKRAAIYCRISDDREGSGLGVARQEKDCKALCKQRGFAVAGVFVDNDRSAYTGKKREAWTALIESVKNGDVDVIVCWHQDRLTRHPRELEDLAELIESTGIMVATVTAGDFDLSTPTGRMIARIVGATARGESEHKSERIKRKARELAERGKVNGGGRAFGYEQDRSIHKREAKLVREAAERVLDGEPLRSVVRDWIARGIKTTTGAAWGPTTLRRMLMSARISGRREHHGVITADAEWDAIIPPDESDALRAILSAPRTTRARRRYLLTGGPAVCGVCGAALVARPRDDGRKAYVCASGPLFSGCGKIRILGDDFEQFVTGAVLERLDTPELAAEIAATDDTDDDTVDELRRIEDRRVQLAELWADGEMSRADWTAARRRLDERTKELQAEIKSRTTASRSTRLVRTRGLRDRWETLGLDEQKDVIGIVVDTVTVGPARRGYNRFDPNRISIKWKEGS
jgi:DNA invertase Pin-like site-specific DNA recombinase